MQPSETTPLRAECDHCGAPDALLRRHTAQNIEYLCQSCTKQDALSVAALDQLEVLIGQVVRAWQQDWPEEAQAGIGELVSQVGRKLAEKLTLEEAESAATVHR